MIHTKFQELSDRKRKLGTEFGDFSGYKSVIIPWISNDKAIRGLILFNQDNKAVVSWPSGAMDGLSIEELTTTNSLTAKGDNIFASHRIFDNMEKIGYLVFISDFKSLGLDQLGVTSAASGNCASLEIHNLSVCRPNRNGGRLLFTLAIVLTSILGILLVFFLSVSRLSTHLSKPLSTLHNKLDLMRAGEKVTWSEAFGKSSDPVFRPIGEYFSETVSNLKSISGELESKREVSELARQVAHDIRSPLSAIEVSVAGTDSGIPEERLKLLRAASDRIQGIAAELLEKSKRLDIQENSKKHNFCVSHCIREVAAEKQAIDPGINLSVTGTGKEVFAVGDANDFKRALSNLIDNSIQASKFSDSREISVGMRQQSGRAVVYLQDQGIGIPEAVLSKIGQRGFTFAKENGNGLGVHFAMSKISEWGGDLRFSSKEKVGTLVTISLPCS